MWQYADKEDGVRVLTIRQPWAWLIQAGYKDLENRSWSTPYRGPLLIHAGAAFDSQCDAILDEARSHDMYVPARAQLTRGALVAVVDLMDVITEDDPRADSIWFFGPYGWVLAHPRPIVPIPSKGRLGFWDYSGPITYQEAQHGPRFP